METPGFTAELSLPAAAGHRQYMAVPVPGGNDNRVVPQLKGGPYSWERANAVKGMMGFGTIRCVPDCSGITDFSHTQFCPEVCTWWPY